MDKETILNTPQSSPKKGNEVQEYLQMLEIN